MGFYAVYPPSSGGASGGVPTYPDANAFPSAAAEGNGALAIALDTNILYESDGTNWIPIAGPAGVFPALTANRAVVTDSIGALAVSATTDTEIGYVHGVTGDIQTQLDGKQATITGAATTITTSDLTADRAVISDGSGKVAIATTTATEIGYVNGVTSAIQTQLNGKQASGNYITALTGDVTASGPGSAAATIAAGAVTASKLGAVTDGVTLDQSGAGSTLEIKAGGVGSTQIASGAVTTAKLGTVTDGVTLDQSGSGSTLEVKAGGIGPTQLAASITNGLMPLGSVIPVFSNLTGSFTLPSSGTVSAGKIRCDGAAIPGGNTVSGNTPDLTSGRFIYGTSGAASGANPAAGGTGGAATVTLGTTNLPTGTIGTVTPTGSVSGTNISSSISGTAAAQTWTYNAGSGSADLVLLRFPNGGTGNAPNNPGNSLNAQWTNGTSGATAASVTFDHSHSVSGVTGTNGSSSVSGTAAAQSWSGSFSGSSGNVASSGSATAFSILPTYVAAVYLMRVS